MNSQQVIQKLGYSDSPAFLHGGRLREHRGYSFLFAQAEREDRCNLKGVYTLAPPEESVSGRSLTPLVYVCEVDNEAKAHEIHRRVWNQNVVPFLIVVTPKNIRLYSGFEYDRNKSDQEQVLQIATRANEILSKLSAFTSEAIDSGDIWDRHKVTTESRVDRHLLKNLDKLSGKLTGPEYGLSTEHAHTLIGKYIYLKYLKDRGILSSENFSKARVTEEHVFSRGAQKEELYKLEEWLDTFLNGSVFPLPNSDKLRAEHIQKVAAVFGGDDPESGQESLFDIYDFSYVPIETLSVVYQQFLHAQGQGRSKGAYYTPVHLVNFILNELEAKKPIKEGMKIFDASCGSGAFLVQCYRRLVEDAVREKGELKPTELRSLLTSHVFGLDADEGACRVAELSLSLTLLDYIDPPDLSKTNFKLPCLHNQNIFYCEGGFFDENSLWAKSMPKKGYDWIVGNPPWKNRYDKNKSCDRKAIEWIDSNKEQYPVGQRQLAEAFAWKTTQILSERGQCGLLMPALTLFKKHSKSFRASFFSQIETWCVVNFANLRHLLFEGAVNPAGAFFFSGRKDWNKAEHYISSYAPFAVEQFSQAIKEDKSQEMWTVYVNYSAIKEIPSRVLEGGSSTPWKVSMWGTHRDELLLDSIKRRHSVELIDFLKQNELSISQGLEWRDKVPQSEPVEAANEIRGRWVLQMDKLKGAKDVHSFGPEVLKSVSKKKGIYVREGRKQLPLSVCNPPHIIIDECRRMAVYSDEFIVVPPMQLGIGGKNNQRDLLKAIALYLKSNAAYYFQLWMAVKIGVERDVFNLEAMKRLPLPVSALSGGELAVWAELHDEVVKAEKREREFQENEGMLFSNSKKKSPLPSLDSLIRGMNDRVYKALGVTEKQRWLIEDMLNIRFKLNDGRIAREATDAANKKEIDDFARIFQDELDLFLDHGGQKRVHKLKVLCADRSAVMIVDHLEHSATDSPIVEEVKDARIREELYGLEERLGEERRQWMYFRRCLRVYEGRRTYIFKPRQRLYWLKSQALVEADEFIAEKLATE